MIEQRSKSTLPRIGLIASDAMRIMGLRAILGDGEVYEILSVTTRTPWDTESIDVVLLDAATAGHGFELLSACRRLKPAPAVIVLGPDADPAHVERVIAAGAKGYLSHAASEEDLRMAVAVVRDGSIWAPRKVLAHLLDGVLDPGAPTAGSLRFTPRETEVLGLLVQGHPNRQIARLMRVDEGTVKAHVGRLMRKAGVDNRTALTMRAVEGKWAVGG